MAARAARARVVAMERPHRRLVDRVAWNPGRFAEARRPYKPERHDCALTNCHSPGSRRPGARGKLLSRPEQGRGDNRSGTDLQRPRRLPGSAPPRNHELSLCRLGYGSKAPPRCVASAAVTYRPIAKVAPWHSCGVLFARWIMPAPSWLLSVPLTWSAE